MNFEILNFTTFCVGSLADALKMSAGKVYELLRTSGILTGYLIPGYEVLHTFSKEYIVEDLIQCMKKKDLYFAGAMSREDALGRLAFEHPNHQLCILNQEVITNHLHFISAEEITIEGNDNASR